MVFARKNSFSAQADAQRTAKAPVFSKVLVTGASTGIGHAIVADLIRAGATVYASVRRKADADALTRTFGAACVPLLFDVTDDAAVQRAAAALRKDLGDGTLDALVNNAGIGTGGPLLHQPLAEIRNQFDVNVFGAIGVTQAFFPLLRRGVRGAPGARVVMMSSVSGKMCPPFMGAYSGSKHALEAMSASLRRELFPFGIDVVVIGPGGVNTPIWDKEPMQGLNRYNDTPYGAALRKFAAFVMDNGKKGLAPEDVAASVREALTVAKPHTRYALVKNLVSGWLVPLALPDRMLDRKYAEGLGLTPEAFEVR